jgi:hypothetical protein
LEHLSNHTWLPLRITCAALGNIFGVVSGDNFLTSLCVIHHRLLVREESIEAPVEDTSGDEGEYIADIETAKHVISIISTKWRRLILANSKLFASKLIARKAWGKRLTGVGRR